MQFHLNGFRGDPLVAEASAHPVPHLDAAPAEVDVLIVGCGPAGLTLAAQLAAFPDIRTCIVEQKDGADRDGILGLARALARGHDQATIVSSGRTVLGRARPQRRNPPGIQGDPGQRAQPVGKDAEQHGGHHRQPDRRFPGQRRFLFQVDQSKHD